MAEKRRPKTDENGLPSKEWLYQLWLDVEHEKICGNNDILTQTLDLLLKTAYRARGEAVPEEKDAPWNKTQS